MKFTGKELLIATKNKGKVVEIEKMLSKYGISLSSAADLDITEPEETGSTFIANAELKARYYGKDANMPALADDSGLCIEALDGKPGVHSARYASELGGFENAMQKLGEELDANPNKKAKFVCALALYLPESSEIFSFEGEINGTLTFPARGDHGFGYDPIFIPNGYDKTFAEIDKDIKQKISHRADAFEKFIAGCF